MTKIYSLNSDVKFPDMEHYDIGEKQRNQNRADRIR